MKISNAKQILSYVLAGLMLISSVVLPPISASADAKYDTGVFAGNATYLIQERFASTFVLQANGNSNNAVLSGWEVDYRGGNVSSGGGKATLTDSNGYEKITLNRQFMPHSGDNLVLETAFSYSAFTDDGLYIRVSGEGKDALYLTVDDGYICLQTATGINQPLVQCSADTVYKIKAELSGSKRKVRLWINGADKGSFAYRTSVASLDEFEIGTGVEQVSKIVFNYVYMYVNYALNETFMSSPEGSVPGWWTASGSSCVAAAPGSPYDADLNGFSLAPSGTLKRSFDSQSGKSSIAWEMLVPDSGADGMKMFAGSGSSDYVSFTASNGKFALNGSPVYEYTNNVWYKIELVTEGNTADVYINNVLRAENIPVSGDSFDFIRFENGSSKSVILDDITVSKALDSSDFADYPTVSEVAQSDTNLGMVIYPMWREGIHYGWDAITPYEERTPYLGYYTGGSREVADWDNKWLLEHGFDHAIFPFARPDITEAGGQVNFSVRGEALHDGYLTSEYKDQLDFSVMLCSATANNYTSADEFMQNVQPFLIEHYFKNPSYKAIDNRLLVYSYDFDNISTQLGGDDQLHAVLISLNNEVAKLDNGNGGTYDGITFMADISSTAESYVNSYISTQNPAYKVYKWHYTWGSDKYENIINGIKNEYSNGSNSVASIPMGFDNTPWKYNEIGFISPEGIQSICEAVKSNKGSDDPNLVVFTCWDEWGEGHFFAPSALYGFDYLNVVRKTFTSLGEKTNEDRPTDEAVARMDVLHPQGRQILKIKKDTITFTASDLSSLTSLGSKILSSERGSASNCSRDPYPDFLGKGYTYTVTGSPATVTYNLTSPSIDASKITAIKINGYAQNSSEMVLYIETNTSGGIDNTDFRFSGSCDGTTTATDNILFPDNPSALSGTIKKIRFNPSANTSNGSKFRLNSIEFYSGNIGTKVYVGEIAKDTNGNAFVEDVEYELTSPVEISDTAYIPAYQFLLNLSAYTEWDKASKTLTVQKDDITAVLVADSKVMNVNGEDITLDYAPYYKEGNLYMPYTGVLEHFGYRAEYNASAGTIKYYNKKHDDIDTYKSTNKWEFDIDDYDEGWVGSGVFQPMNVKNGMLHIAASTKDPVLNMNNISIAKADAKYALIRILKTDRPESGMLRLYDPSTSASGVVYGFKVSASKNIQEFVIDLTKDYVSSSTYTNTYEALGDTITKLRLDPMDNTGSMYIDSIQILKEKPSSVKYDYELKAYGWETENMVQLDTDKNRYVYTNIANRDGGTSGTVLPVTETVDGYTDVIKLVPNAGVNNGIFSIDKIWYNGTSEYVGVLCNDKRIIKLSFFYKTIGNCTGMRFENRKGGARDGEEFTISDVSTTEWKYFEQYIDMSNETVASSADRWLSLRVLRNGYAVTDGGVYIRDYKVVCLDETTELSSFEGDTVAVAVSKKSQAETELSSPDVYVAGFDASGNISSVIAEAYPRTINVTINGASVQENSKYYYFRPSDDTSVVKGYFWDNMLPVSSVLNMKK